VSTETGTAAADAIQSAATALAPEISEHMAAVYATTFRIDELKAILAFLETPAGKAVLGDRDDQQAASLGAGMVFSRAVSKAARIAYCARRDCTAGDDPLEFARETEGPHPRVQIGHPRWAETPREDQLMAARPAMARWLRLDGFVRLTCTADAIGALRDCSIARESPAGVGFGAAALSMRSHFRLSSSLVAEGAAGERVSVVLRFPDPPVLDADMAPEARSQTSLTLSRELLEARYPSSVVLEGWQRQLAVGFQTTSAGVSEADLAAFKAAMTAGFLAARAESRTIYATLLTYLLTDEQLKAGVQFWRSPVGQTLARRGPDLRDAEMRLQRAYGERIYRLAGRLFCEERGCVSSLAAPAPPLPAAPPPRPKPSS
jgi:hypothetical protein